MKAFIIIILSCVSAFAQIPYAQLKPVYTSPSGGAETAMKADIDTVKTGQAVLFLAYCMSEKPAYQALAGAATRGASVNGVIDVSYGLGHSVAAIAAMKAAHVSLWQDNARPGGSNKCVVVSDGSNWKILIGF